MEFKGTKGKWKAKVTRSSNFNGDEAVVVFSDVDNTAIDKGVCRLTILNGESKVVQGVLEMKANALLISKAPEMLEMLKRSLEEIRHLKNEYRDVGHCVKYLHECGQLIKEATEI